MKVLVALFFVALFLVSSCAKDDLTGFDAKITNAYDYRVNPVNGDTFYRFYMPNGFSPNSDGVNDYYYPVGVGIDPDNYEFKIFSRKNNLIFYSTDVSKAWDGRVQGSGEICSGDVFTVEIHARDSTQEVHHYLYEAVKFR